MISCNLLKLSFFNFYDKKCVEFSQTSFDTLSYDCVINTIEIFNFLPLINNSVTTGLRFFIINHTSNHIIKN